ncbi:DUF6867 family protein [Methylobacterium nodulans]|uniref:DUF6867 domain-containing protein n=1 Tax=Methylobacterium nodulans (strain LMG 21967 / CNCM I-2342 / ORS 2060) TaxID=460265 RepID=B8IR30_METNO|nr:hypothetical protein [Methylobacterium nodulans]ACL56732.1 conserved hypothetical protein [Methylobacterium nodulans ORS 2060]
MQGILYEESTVWLFLLVTVVMGGWAAWMTARGIALGWRPYWQVVLALGLLGLAVRFIHFALFEGTMLSPHYYLVDTLVLLLIGSVGYRATRARQMTTQYRWLYERTGPLTWREKPWREKPSAGA